VTRSIGDVYLKSPEFNRDPLASKYRVAEPFSSAILRAEPSISVIKLESHHRFFIFASDGLWDHLSNQQAIDIVFNNPRNVSSLPFSLSPNLTNIQLDLIKNDIFGLPTLRFNFHNQLGIARRLVKAALHSAAKKREMRYSDLKKVDAGVRRHFHDDISCIVVFLDDLNIYKPSFINGYPFSIKGGG
ncbi:putative protein phosphatase 2C 28, partial [Bienertia sinuspersici]